MEQNSCRTSHLLQTKSSFAEVQSIGHSWFRMAKLLLSSLTELLMSAHSAGTVVEILQNFIDIARLLQNSTNIEHAQNSASKQQNFWTCTKLCFKTCTKLHCLCNCFKTSQLLQNSLKTVQLQNIFRSVKTRLINIKWNSNVVTKYVNIKVHGAQWC